MVKCFFFSVGRSGIQYRRKFICILDRRVSRGQKIAQMLLVSLWILRRRVVEYGPEEITSFSMISNEQQDNLVEGFIPGVTL